MNYDVEQFFTKWLADMAADQRDDGYVGHVIPDLLQSLMAALHGETLQSSAWEIYLPTVIRQILKIS